MEIGLRYRVYAELRETKLSMKSAKQQESEEIEFKQAPTKKQVKFSSSLGSSRKGSSILTQSVLYFSATLRKENRQPVMNGIELTPPTSKNWSKRNGVPLSNSSKAMIFFSLCSKLEEEVPKNWKGIERKETKLNCIQSHDLFLFVFQIDAAKNKIWRMAFFVIKWSIWLFKNEMVFNGKSWDELKLMDIIKTRIAYWSKARWDNPCLSFLDFFKNPELGVVFSKKKFVKKNLEWIKPALSELKFNVDGAAKGCPGEIGIGGVLRDYEGRIKLQFSKSTGWGDSNLAELLAIKEAFLLFATSP
ncbi:Uncharacterized protein TCM_031615 [Theobroma cacao]|uniref:RNase H type-1 domain-containing protein n=1 Tax=Theobroma cacao TaxID=3641 RepID=A0A061FF45_THECC|nr:Uncharacterized protein TCM_031615 [Theobroma cacao]